MATYLEDEVSVEQDLIHGREKSVERARAEVDEGVGGKEASGYWRLPMEPIVLSKGVNGEKGNHRT